MVGAAGREELEVSAPDLVFAIWLLLNALTFTLFFWPR